MTLVGHDYRFDVYLKDRLDKGWTAVRLKGDADEVEAWLRLHVGDEHPTEDWGPALDHEMWEFTVFNAEDEVYDALIRNKEAAMLTKLTWG